MKQGNHALDSFFLYRLCILSRDMRTLAARSILGPQDLDIRDWFVLTAINELGSASQREIVAHTSLDKVAVNRATTRLKDRGLLTMRSHKLDGRSHMLQLSDAGRDVITASTAAIAAMEHEFLAGLSVADIEQLSDLLARLKGSVEKLEQAEDEWEMPAHISAAAGPPLAFVQESKGLDLAARHGDQLKELYVVANR